MEKQALTPKEKVLRLIDKCIELNIFNGNDEQVAVCIKVNGKSEWLWLSKSAVADDIIENDSYGLLEDAIVRVAEVEKLVSNCLEEGILIQEDGRIFLFVSIYGSDIAWKDRTSLVQDLMCQEPMLRATEYNPHSEEYLREMYRVKKLCEEKFPELHESIFGEKDIDFVFNDGFDSHRLYYFNPDSWAGGQIVECPFDDEMAERMMLGEDAMDVLAELPQYLGDINTTHFFDNIDALVRDRETPKYVGSDEEESITDLMTKLLPEKKKIA